MTGTEELMMNEYEVTEMCPHCESEITMTWDVHSRGYKAFCPVCGERLMLCDECQHSGADGEYAGGCDYDSQTDTCKHNRGKVATVDGKMEFGWMKDFLREVIDARCLGDSRDVDLLRMFWTAHCFHERMECDTAPYDNELMELWEVIDEANEHPFPCLLDYDAFDLFMGEYLC